MTNNSIKSALDNFWQHVIHRTNVILDKSKRYADTKADAEHEHTVANIGDLTVTATELNYMDGVTSGVQVQLNGKVPTSRTVNGKALTDNITLSAGDVSAYTKAEVDAMEFITVDDIDAICGGAISYAEDVMF